MFTHQLASLKIEALNKMQLATIEAAKPHADILLLSPTGSGKTLAFLLPVLKGLDASKPGVQALILVPSRELAIQIEQVFKQMSTGFKINCCYGGHATRIEKNNLSSPPAVLVGTPGRIAYHARNNNFDAASVQTLVLDEFDKSLESGFQEDMSEIISFLSGRKRTLLTSATSMKEIPAFAGIKKLVTLDFLSHAKPVRSELQIKYLRADDQDKLQLLFRLICALNNKLTLVFCNHREAVDRIGELLEEKGLSHGVFHGGMEQEDRERTLIKFRNGSHRLLITTDLASRGLDIPEIEAVVHYQLPVTNEVYTHRNGRTARMNAHGTAYILLSSTEHIPPFIKTKPELEKLPERAIIPGNPPWRTLYFGAGKKDKIGKIDIVGVLLQKGKLAKDELGLIEVLDRMSFAAVKNDKIEKVVALIRNEKMKGRKIKVEIS